MTAARERQTLPTLSNGRTVHADYNPIANCGNFDNGQIKVKSGAALTGCVTFQVPKGPKIIMVSYRNTVFPRHHRTMEHSLKVAWFYVALICHY